MCRIRTLIAAACLAALLDGALAAENDPLQAALEESRALGKGLTFYVNGQPIAGVVVSVGDRYVLARSNAQGTIVIRIDRIDAVAGFVGGEPRKTP